MMQRLFQFTLDLFEPESAAPVVPLKSTSQAEKPLDANKEDRKEEKEKKEEKEAFGHISCRPPAIESIALALLPDAAYAPQTLTQALAPASFRHPQASREILLGSVSVAYALRRGKRRTIGFSVGPEGLKVSAPKWVPLYEIDKSVLEKSGWILKKLQETRDRHQQMESVRIEWKNGCILPFLGAQVVVVLDPKHAFGGLGAELKTNVCGPPSATDANRPGLALHIGLPHSATAGQIRDAVQAWLMRQARRIFTERLDHFAPRVRVQWRKLGLSSASTRWGSARADGSIRLNWRLVHLKLAVIDYVVVHELSHLQVMDHSPRFWEVVRAVVPDYASLREQLKSQSVPRW